MAIFEIENGRAKRIKLAKFKLEEDLQKLVEDNLETIFNCQFIATEFYTGDIHSGYIDTLALSEDNNPVIIEYKKQASSHLVNQSLYYLHWIKDHKGDFQVAANKALGREVEIDWSDIRVICLAPEYRKYDLHAVQVMGANIELWQYKLYENGILNIEDVFSRTNRSTSKGKKKLADKKNRGIEEVAYTIEPHFNRLNKKLQELFNTIRDYIVSIDSSVEEAPKKYYIAYKTSQNFVCLETTKQKIRLYLKLNPDEVPPIRQGRDVREIGHFGTGDYELTLKNLDDFEAIKQLIDESYRGIGG